VSIREPVKPTGTLTKVQPKAHATYKTSDGELVPGVTTVLNLLEKGALVGWAYNLGRTGVDMYAARAHAQKVGSLTHAMIEASLRETKCDPSSYTQEQIDAALGTFAAFVAWRKTVDLRPLLIEAEFASDTWKYGGTLDLYAKVGDLHCIIDFKTGSDIYEEALYQGAAYRNLVEEAGYPVDAVYIVRMGKGAGVDYGTKMVTDTALHFTLFTHLLAVYRLKKMIGGEYKTTNRPEIQAAHDNDVTLDGSILKEKV